MYFAQPNRYDNMQYRRVGSTGLKLSAIALGLWHNFGDVDALSNQREIIQTAFDNGITYFDLANNYGPPAGSAEINFGRILREDLAPYRDEMVIATKAGYYMWPGPYGEWGSKKNIIASCDQSLKRLGLDYVDIFYHHRPDPNTPLEETAQALDLLVRQGKALYIGISNYSAAQTAAIAKIFKQLKTPFIVHQARYNMLDRWVEDGLLTTLADLNKGMVAFSPLAQGRLTDRYLHGIPADSRANRTDSPFLDQAKVAPTVKIATKLNEMAQNRGQSLAQMALAWNLREQVVASVIVGASRSSQLLNNLKALDQLDFSVDELAQIETLLKN